jgi:hypothetical protein
MESTFIHLRRPRRVRLYLAAGIGLLCWYAAVETGGPAFDVLSAAFCISATIWLGARERAAGMEIGSGRFNIFVGPRHWSVPLREIRAVRVQHADSGERLVLRCADGRNLGLPRAVTPNLRALERALASRGIPLEA